MEGGADRERRHSVEGGVGEFEMMQEEKEY